MLGQIQIGLIPEIWKKFEYVFLLKHSLICHHNRIHKKRTADVYLPLLYRVW